MDTLTHSIVDRTIFRDAMSRVAAPVHLVTTDGPAGKRGVTVTSVCSVSDSPATLLVCLNRSSTLNARFNENGVFAVNVLTPADEALARAFAGEGGIPPEERFAQGRWTQLATGAPILERALVSFDCRLVDSRMVATHQILFGEVEALRVSEADAKSLLYKDRNYHDL